MYVADRDSLERLQEAAGQGRKTRTWPRVQAVVLAKQGDTAPEIARALGVSRRAVQAWVAAYNRGGLEALPDRPHPGRPPILPRSEEGRFLERIDAPPRPEDGACALRGADIAASSSRSSVPATASTGSTSCCVAWSTAA